PWPKQPLIDISDLTTFDRSHPTATRARLSQESSPYGSRIRKTRPSAGIVTRRGSETSTNVEHAIRLAVSLGGDSDTQAAIAGGIAHAFYRDSATSKREIQGS